MRAQYTPPGLRAILAGLLGLLICFILFLRFPLSEQHWLTLLPERSAPPLYLLMPINEARARSDHNFCRAAKAALIQGYRPILYNWDFQANVWQTQGAKIPGLLDFMNIHLKHEAAHAIVVLMDSLDVWLQLSPQTMLERYRRLDSRIVFGADRFCWPNTWNSPECLDAPPSPLPPGLFTDEDAEQPHSENPEKLPALYGAPRFANSGFVMGQLPYMRRFFDSLNTTLHSPGWPWETDQSAFNLFLNDPDVTLDYRLQLIWSNNADTTSGLPIAVTSHPDGVHYADDVTPWHLYPTLVRHQITGEVPVAVHFNAFYEKFRMEETWHKTWYAGTRERFRGLIRERLEGAELRIFSPQTGMRAIPFDSICQDV